MERLRICNLHQQYKGGIKALNGVSLEVPNGLFGLLGPNGAGKSTLMRTIATLQSADAGEIYFDGINIIKDPQVMRRQLGYLPQDFGVYRGVSAQQLLDHMAVLKGLLQPGERKEQVEALLQRTNLYHARKQAVSAFSGGMRQRFGIAQALLGKPQLIIADEPTAGLDPEERNRFHDLLSEIGEQVVVILSTHIVEDVRDLCPQMAVLAAGNIILQGKPAALRASLEGKVWRKSIRKDALPDYMAAFNVLSTRLLAGSMQLHVWSEGNPGDEFEPYEAGLEEVYFAALKKEEATAC